MVEIEVDQEKDGAEVVAGKELSAEELFQQGRDANDKGEVKGDEGKDVPFHEHPRWKQVYGENKEYKELGSPAEIKERLAKVDELEGYIGQLNDKIEALDAKREEGEPKTDKQKQYENLRKQARGELGKIAPELDEVARQKVEWDLFYTSLERQAYRETAKLLKDAGLPTTQKDVMDTANVLAEIIAKDPDLFLDYRTATKEAVREAWDRLTKRYSSARAARADIEREKKDLSKLPKPHSGGGSAERGAPPERPKTLREAERSAAARLKGMQRE